MRILCTPLDVVGVRIPALRKVAKGICREDWRSFVSQPTANFEHCLVKALVIATVKVSGEERLALTKEFLPEIVDWAVCDTFCGAWKVTDDVRGELWDWCVSLLGTGEEFPMRVGAVMLMSKFIDGEHIGSILGLLTSKRESPGYYWDMGCAWALSFCYIAFPDETEEAIFAGDLTPEVLRMTVYKVRDSYRVSGERKKALKARYQELRARSS